MTHYTTLGVSPTASPEEIKKAYRQAVSIHHPDKGGSVSIFQQVQKAYEVLSDPIRRKEYDFAQSKKPVESLRESMEILVSEFVESCKTN